jgi:tRNA pseudouridine13 synthase
MHGGRADRARIVQPEEFLNVPHAHGGPAGRARVRATPEDFVVREWLGFAADGEGEHLLLTVRKRGANTMWVAKQLARLGKLDARDIGIAGLKDRDAVAVQHFTLPARSAIGDAWAGVQGEGFEVLEAARHRRKLKRGALRGNEFEIRLRDFQGDRSALDARLQAIAAQGAPNYFGPQRFGRAGANLALAACWFSGAAQPERAERGFALSAARAALFNAVLAERVRTGTWNRIQDGDVANLDGSGSIFLVAAVDETLRERCGRLDIHPTGPMWGAGELAAGAGVANLECTIGQRHGLLSSGLERAGLEQERRALRMSVRDLEWSLAGADVQLRFRLPRGSFATAVLHELLDEAFAAEAPDAGD